MITKDKVTEIFCIIDEFDKNLSAEFAKKQSQPCSLKIPLDTQLYHELVFCPYSILLL